MTQTLHQDQQTSTTGPPWLPALEPVRDSSVLWALYFMKYKSPSPITATITNYMFKVGQTLYVRDLDGSYGDLDGLCIIGFDSYGH